MEVSVENTKSPSDWKSLDTIHYTYNIRIVYTYICWCTKLLLFGPVLVFLGIFLPLSHYPSLLSTDYFV